MPRYFSIWEKMTNACGILVENLEVRDYFRDLRIDGSILL
jgi:hypothetical protein